MPTWAPFGLQFCCNGHSALACYALWLCPVADVFAQDDWQWSIRQVEYSTDLMFRSEQILLPLQVCIARTV